MKKAVYKMGIKPTPSFKQKVECIVAQKSIITQSINWINLSPFRSVVFVCSCDKVYHKQEVRFFCIHLVRLSPDNETLFHSIEIDNVLLQMIIIDN